MQQYGVDQATLDAAKAYGSQGLAAGGLVAGGLAPKGFVLPADVVGHLGNGSSEAGLKLLVANLGAEPIKGEGDGMSDSIPTTIGGKQEARVANDEAFISPERVERIGGGDAEKGAKKLYAMMDRVREERTGTTKQGKQIDPNKFMPGGSVQKYQTGGTTVPKTTPAGATGVESSLSNWGGDYVTNMLGQGAALANAPYQAYTGPLTAGASQLQQQAFNMAGNFQTPASIGQAANTAGGIANLATNMRYTPQTTSFLGTPNRTGLDMAPSYGMGMGMAPPPTGGTTPPPAGIYNGRGPLLDSGPRNDYDPQQDNGIAHVQWEGPGNPRWEAEQRSMQKPRPMPSMPRPMPSDGGMQKPRPMPSMPRPMPSDGGMFQTQPMREYGGSQYNPATGAESRDMGMLQPGDPRLDTGGERMRLPTQPQLGKLPTQLQEPQFGMFGGAAQGLPEALPQASQPVGNIAQQYMNPYLESALRPQMAEMQRAADIARVQDAGRLTQAGAFGGSRQAIMESEGRRNLMGKQSDALAQGYSTAYDKAMQQFNADQARSAQEAQFGATFGLQGLQTGLQGAQTQAQAGALEAQTGLAGLKGMLEAGGIERGIESEGIAADKAQFEEARLNPYKMVQFQQSLLSGLPLAAQSYNVPGQSGLQQFAGGATTIDQLLKILTGQQAATTKP
jgi:hypothetical protein